MKKVIDFLKNYPGELTYRHHEILERLEAGKELYDIQKILVSDIINYEIPMPPEIDEEPTDQQLSDFGKTYCRILGSVHKNLKSNGVIITDSDIWYRFYFGDEMQPKFSRKEILKERDGHCNLIYYDRNTVNIIKPNKLRYWLKSEAVADADATFADLVAQGY